MIVINKTVQQMLIPNGIVSGAVAALQVMLIVPSYMAERKDPMEYSKFAVITTKTIEKPIPSQQGMLLCYVPAMIVSGLWITVPYVLEHKPLMDAPTVAWLLFVLFFKRTLEVLFVHKYSGIFDSSKAYMISTSYALNTIAILSFAVASGIANPTLTLVGNILFVIGCLGNFYHHYLLASLRKNKTTTSATAKDTASKGKQYQPPRGGLFHVIATPHYLFELIAWFGIALVAQHINAILIFGMMAAYLAGRAQNTNEYYLSQFTNDEWSKTHKALIPYIF